MSLSTNLHDFIVRASSELKSHKTLINGNAADLSSLQTTNKANLVAAINEVALALAAVISDGSTSTGTTWSSSKIQAEIQGAINALVDGAPEAMDTLKELADAISASGDVSGILDALSKRVRTDTPSQGLDAIQKANARQNIDVYSKAEIGSIDTDFVALFESGLA